MQFLLAIGSVNRAALELADQGLDTEVRSIPSIKPLDQQQLREITSRVDCLGTLEEYSVMGGLGTCVAEEVAVHRPLPVCRIGIEDRFSTYCGIWDYLLQEHRLDLPSVKHRIESFLAALPARTAGTPTTACSLEPQWRLLRKF